MKHIKLFENIDFSQNEWDDIEPKKHEKMKESWVNFTRFYCKEGYIDRWTGDSSDNPNKEKPHPMNLNSTATFFRLNDGEWTPIYYFNRRFDSDIYTYRKEFSAEEIWDENYKGYEEFEV